MTTKRRPVSIEVLARRAGKKISRALAEVAKACVDQGLTTDPTLFFEPESRAIFVQDGNHPGRINATTVNAGERQEANVAAVPVVVPGVSFDAGAW